AGTVLPATGLASGARIGSGGMNLHITASSAPDPGSNYDTGSKSAAARSVADAQHALSCIVAQLTREFEESAEVRETQSMLAKTTRDFADARMAALIPLRETIEYKQLAERVTQLEQRLHWGKFDDHMTDAQIAQSSQALLQARLARSAIEAKALASDPAVSSARFGMIDAAEKLSALRRDFRRMITSNPEYAAAHDRLEAAYA